MKHTTIKNIGIGYLSGLGSGISWGLDAVLLGLVMSMSPFITNPVLLIGGTLICSMLHDIFAAVWIGGTLGITGHLKGLRRSILTKDAFFCVLGALFGGPLAMSFYLLSIDESGPAVAATITACYPLLGSVLAVLVLKEKVSRYGWFGLLICVFGIVWIGYEPSSLVNNNLTKGILFAIIAAIGWATEGVICGYGMKQGNISPQNALLIREFTSGLAYCLILVPLLLHGYANVFIGIQAITSASSCLLLLVFTSLIGMISFLLWYTSIDMIGAAKALCLNVTYSFWAVLFSFIIIGTTLTRNVCVGSLLIIGGVCVATLLNKKMR